MKKLFEVKLRVNGKPPKYMKVYTEGEMRGKVFVSENKLEFKDTKMTLNGIMEIRLYEYIYKHIQGNDIEHWMLFELKEDKLKEIRNGYVA